MVTGPRLDEPYLRETSAGTHSLLPDALGSILMATDAAQATVTSYSYDAYGATLQTGTNDNSQQYTGRENDGTGLYYYRARYYSPQMGRFISQDPIGWASGQTNNYAYVNGNPISYTDPEGKFGLVGALVGAGLDIGMQMIIGGKSLKCVNISSVLTSAAVGAFTPGLLTVGGLAVGAEKTVAMWGWLGARDAAIWQGVGAVTGATLKTATKSDPWTIGDDCECKK